MRLVAAVMLIVFLRSAALAADDDERPRLDWRPSPRPPPKANPMAMTSAGASMVTAALTSIGVGAYFLTKPFAISCDYSETCTPAQKAAIDRDLDVGGATALLGFVTLGIGIPLLITGADRVASARKKRRILPILAPTAGGASAGLILRF